ncbi:MraY family glycosyltransferase [Luteimonas salinilitoris]|uniref:Glycosyltransferase family 4 protein n=1 Tax=Luteimonas salinilitoris TaxID=3237697 RepID=A0ABV4HRG4_9GAMM
MLGTWAARRYALHRKLLDEPGERRSHAIATPRGGGIAIVASLLAALALLALRYPGQRTLLLVAGGGVLLVAAIGWIDDHRPLSPWLRLVVHAVAAAMLATAVLQSDGGALLAAIGFAAALVLVNVWNFMDGIDGLAASQAAIAALGYALLAHLDGTGGAVVWLAFSLAVACLGFLPFNFPRARIFLGDVGSGALGYGLACVCVLAMAGGEEDAPGRWPLLALPLSAFLVDATLTLGSRMLRGEPWWRAHVQHAYQRWSRRIGRHPPVTIAYAAWSACSVLAMLAAWRLDTAYIIALAVAWYLAGGWIWIALQDGTHRTGLKEKE